MATFLICSPFTVRNTLSNNKQRACTHMYKNARMLPQWDVSLSSFFIVELTKGEVVCRWKMKQIVVYSGITLKRGVTLMCESVTNKKNHEVSNTLMFSDLHISV